MIKFCNVKASEATWTSAPLYQGSKWKVEDLLIILEMFKVTGKMGDGFENCILGLIASILPHGIHLSAQLNDTSKTNYFFQKTIKYGHHRFKKMRVLQISCCRDGCSAFIGENQFITECPICEKENIKELNETIFYFPLVDRLAALINSDLSEFLMYPNLRPRD